MKKGMHLETIVAIITATVFVSCIAGLWAIAGWLADLILALFFWVTV